MKVEKQEKTIDEKIVEWKKKYTDVFQLDVTTGDGKKVSAYLHSPDIGTMGAVNKCIDIDADGKVKGFDTVRSGLIILENCQIESDPLFDTDDQIRYSAAMRCMELFKTYESELKKL